MSLNSSIYKEILKEYDEIQTNSKKQLKSRKKYIYSILPKIEQIDKQLSLLGVNITKAIINKTDNIQTLISNLEKESKQLIEEKEKLLLQYGFSKDYLNLHYICPHCKDTGYINNKICKCMQQKLINKAYSKSNLKNILLYENFQKFNLNFYLENVEEKEELSPRENINSVLKTCHEFINNFDREFSNIIFYGKAGRGKTFLCHCIAKEILDKGKVVLYTTAFELFKMIEEEKFNNNDNYEVKEYLKFVFDVDLLIIDDLGTESGTVVTSSGFYNIINSRLINKKSTIISTNLSPSEWVNMYSDRIVSRIYGNYNVLKIIGEDIRVAKKYDGIIK